MSDYIVKIIPSDPYFCITDQLLQKIAQLIKKNIKADLVEVHMQEKPVFVDCGENLESISCPHCTELLDFGWWDDVMNKAAGNNNTCHSCTYIK